MSISITDNSDKVLLALEKAKLRGLNKIGVSAEGYAKAGTPVDTGRLRNSITYVTSDHVGKTIKYDPKNDKEIKETVSSSDEDAVYIGTNVSYATYVENGARGTAPKHMLKNAATQHKAEYERLMKETLENA